MNIIESIFFDLDGTLIDSMPHHQKAWIKGLNDFQMSISDRDFYQSEGETTERTVSRIYQSFIGHPPSNEWVENFLHVKEQYLDNVFELTFYDNARAILSKLKEEEITLGLVTGSVNFRNRFGENADILDFFSVIVSGSDTKFGKPNPEPYLIALEKTGSNPNMSLVIENAPLGIKSARAAGIDCVAVLGNTPLTEEDLLDSGANVVVKDLFELEKFLCNEYGL